MRILLGAVLLILASGCQLARYYRPGTSYEQAAVDCNECIERSRLAPPRARPSAFERCMEGKGYFPYDSAKLPDGVRKGEVGPLWVEKYRIAGDEEATEETTRGQAAMIATIADLVDHLSMYPMDASAHIVISRAGKSMEYPILTTVEDGDGVAIVGRGEEGRPAQ